MSTLLSNLRTQSAAVFGAGALVFGGMTAPATAQEAPAVQNASVITVEVPMRDARDVSERALRYGAALQSKDAQVLIYFGEDPEVFAALREGAREVIAAGELPLKGIIIASPKDGDWVASHAIEIYTDGTRSRTLRNPDANIARSIGADLAEDHRRSLEVASAPTLDQAG